MRTFLLCMCVALMAGVSHADEARPDYDFEQVSEKGPHLMQWRVNNSAALESVEAVSEAQFVRSGKHAVKVVQSDAQKPGHLYSNVAESIEAGEEYTLSFWAKGNGQARAIAYLYQLNDAGEESFHSTAYLPVVDGTPAENRISGDAQWHEHKYRLKTDDAKAKRARFVIEAAGTVYVDDVQFASPNAPPATGAKDNELAIRPNLISVGPSKAAPRVDGVISDDEYAVRGTALLNNKTQDLYRLSNGYGLAQYGDRFYFALRVSLPDDYKLVEHPQVRDDKSMIATRDAMYLFLRPDGDPSRKAFEGAYLAVAPGGAIYDAWESVDWQKSSCQRDEAFNAAWEVKSTVKDRVWTVELSVPTKDLKLSDASQTRAMAMSFGVNLKDTAIVWQTHPAWFDHYQAFGLVRLVRDALVAEMPNVGNLASGHLTPTFNLNNPSLKSADYALTYLISTPRMVGGGIGSYIFDQIVDQSNKEVVRDESIYAWNRSGTLDAGRNADLTEKAKLAKEGNYLLEIEARSGGQSVAYQKIPFRYFPPIVGELTPIPSKEQIKTEISLAGAAAEERGTVRIDFTDKGGKTVLSESIATTQDEISRKISMAKLPPGEYDVQFVLATKSGSEVARSTVPFRKWETPVWLTEPAGIDALKADWVPKPWTKIERSNDRVAVWGREFRYQPGSLVSDITSLGKSLLAEGAVIKYVTGGAEHAMKLSAPKFAEVHDGRVVLTQTGESPHFTITARQTIEFDGMNRIDLSIAARRQLEVERMWLEVPFRDMPFTALTDLSGRFWQHGIAEDDFFDHSRGYRWLWIGNDDIGCAVFADNYKGWLIDSRKPRLTLKRDGGARRLRLHFVNDPSQVKGPMEITFGLHPTPFKAPFDGWRGIRPDGLGITPPPTNLVMPHASLWNSTDSKPSPRSWQALDDMLAWVHGRGQRAYPYMGAFFISPYDNVSRDFPFDKTQASIPEQHLLKKKDLATRQEEYFYFAEDWLGTPRFIVESPIETRQEARVSPSSSWTDYFVHGIAEMLRRSKLDGVYLDIQQPMTSYDEEKGHVFVTKDGVREGTAELFATRDFYKRMYRVFEENRGDDQHPWMLGHGFGCNVPFASFWDVNFNGEEIKPSKKFEATALNIQRNVVGNPMALITKPGEKDYSGVGYRSVFGGQSGLPNMYLPQYTYLPELKIPEHSREILSLTFVHNNILWPAYIIPQPVFEFWEKVEVPFGMGDTEFFGYWENGLKTSADFVKASYWKKKGKEEYLLAVANWSGEPTTARVQLSAPLAGLKKRTEMESGQGLPTSAEITIEIPPHDLRVIRMQ